MSNDTTPPIEVSGTTLPTALAAALRYLITILGTYAIGKGWVDAENIEGIATLIVTIATVAYGLYRTRTAKKQLIITAEAAPNSVATVTP